MKRLYFKSTKQIIAVALSWISVMILLQAYFIPEFDKLTGQKLLDFSEFKFDTINQIVSNFGDAGVNLYFKIQFFDFLSPLLLGLLLVSICSTILIKRGVKFLFIGYFPYLLTLFDFIENGIILRIFMNYPEQISIKIANTLLFVSSIKTFFYLTSFLLTLGLIIYYFTKTKKTKNI